MHSQRPNLHPLLFVVALVFLISFFMGSLFSSFPPAVRAGAVQGVIVDDVWTFADSPIYVEGDVFVIGTLVIEKDVTVLFNGNYSIFVEGSLIATNVTFTKNITIPIGERWGRIQINQTSSGTLIENCTIEYATVGLNIESSTPTLRGNVLRNNLVALRVNVSSPLIERFSFQDNLIGILTDGGGSPLIENSSFANTISYAFYVTGASTPSTLNSTFPSQNVTIDSGSTLTVKNYLDVRVLDESGLPLPGTDLEVKDGDRTIYATQAFSGLDPLTDAQGYVRWIPAVHGIYVEGTNLFNENSTRVEVIFEPLMFGSNPRLAVMNSSHLELFQATGSDNYPPIVENWSPQGSNAPLTSPISVTFNESMNERSVENSFSIRAGTTVYDSSDGLIAWNFSGNRMTFTPAFAYQYCTLYNVTISGDAHDLAGNGVDGNGDGTGGDPFYWEFTTTSGQPPVVQFRSPTGTVQTSSAIEVIFSKPMNRASVEERFSYKDGGSVFTALNGTFEWIDDTHFLFYPEENLEYGTVYVVTILGNATDLCGLELDGDADGVSEGSPADDFSWTFSTLGSDTLRPEVLWTEPADNETGVEVPFQIVVRFSENMNTTSVERSFAISSGSSNYNISHGDVIWRLGTREMVFIPHFSVRYGSLYNVTINASMATDLSGNPLMEQWVEGSQKGYSWTFITMTSEDDVPPEITHYSPVGADVDVKTMIWVTFSEDMDRESVQTAFTLDGGGRVFGWMDGDFQWTSDSSFTFKPSPDLEYGTTYLVSIDVGATDLNNNPLQSRFEWSFATEYWYGSVYGTVTAEDGKPLENVEVVVQGVANKTATTDDEGGYRITGIPVGTFNITFSKSGYEQGKESFTLSACQEEVEVSVVLTREKGAGDFWWVILVLVMMVILAMLFLFQRGREKEAKFEDLEKEAAVVELEDGERVIGESDEELDVKTDSSE